MKQADVRELRAAERYQVLEPLPGSFGAASVTVRNLAAQGVQIEHEQPLRIGTKGRLWFKRGDITISVQGIVVWSHLSKTPNEKGKYLYVSGIRVDSPTDELPRALQALAERGAVQRDYDSLNRKRRELAEKARRQRAMPVMKMLHSAAEVPSDQALLVQHAREHLRANPNEALKWYNRAKFAITESGPVAADMIRHREDVLAVWEYLERSIELATIAKVFEKS